MRMRKMRTWMRSSGVALGASLVAVVAAGTVRAEGLYRWETESGAIAYTDDAKRIPERYRASVQEVERETLGGYARFTPTDAAASDSYASRLDERLQALRAANAEEPGAPEAAPTAAGTGVRSIDLQHRQYQPRSRLVRRADGSVVRVRYSDYDTVSEPTPNVPIAADPDDPSPVVVEKKQVRVPGEPITQTVTVIRQGDRVLSVVKPRSHYYKLGFGDLSDYEGTVE